MNVFEETQDFGNEWHLKWMIQDEK